MWTTMTTTQTTTTAINLLYSNYPKRFLRHSIYVEYDSVESISFSYGSYKLRNRSTNSRLKENNLPLITKFYCKRFLIVGPRV
ncbi:hypothetical protein V1477_015431 [Vespula maculifrons]